MPQMTKPAPIWRRLAALGYDCFIVAAISLAYVAVVTTIAVQLGYQAQERYRPMFDGFAFQLGWILIVGGYFFWCWKKSGQTIGMKTWKIQLTAAHRTVTDHPGVHWKICLLRCAVSPPMVMLAGVGFWAAAFDPLHRSIQDRLSNTQVCMVD